MAEQDFKSEVVTTEAKPSKPHFYTVGYRPNGGLPNPLPQLTIKGRWLAQAGFRTGQPVIVTVEKGCLMIKAEVNG